MKKLGFSFKEVSPLLFAIFVDILGFGMVYPVLTALFTDPSTSILPDHISNNLRFFYLSLGFLLYPLFMFFGSSFMGDLSDIWGRKKVLMICMFGLALGFFAMGFGVTFSSLTLLLCARGFSGLMSACMPIAMASIADLSTKQNKTVHMSYVTLIQALGFVIGPLFGGILSDKGVVDFFNFSLPFYLSSCLALIAFIWIFLSYQETFIRNLESKINFKRIYQLFVQIAKNPAVRLLSFSFLFMQMGIALYLQLILIYFQSHFNYSSAKMGAFNGFIGFWMALGLLCIVPILAKKYSAEKIAFWMLGLAGLSTLLSSIIPQQIPLWLIVIPLAISTQIAFATMLTSFSNSVSKDSQGWVMGISGSVIALSFTITGMSPSLVPFLGTKPLIFLGGLFLLLAAFLIGSYIRKHSKQH